MVDVRVDLKTKSTGDLHLQLTLAFQTKLSNMFSVWVKGLCRVPSRCEVPQASKLNVRVKNLKGSMHIPFSAVKKCEFFFF